MNTTYSVQKVHIKFHSQKKKKKKDADATANLPKSLTFWTEKVFSSPFTLCLKKVNSGICNKH